MSWVELLFWPLPQKPDLSGKQGKDLGGTGEERGHLTLATPLPPSVIKCMFLAGFVALQSILGRDREHRAKAPADAPVSQRQVGN